MTITRQPALAPSPQPRPAPTARALIGQNVERGGPFWMPIWGPVRAPIDNILFPGHFRNFLSVSECNPEFFGPVPCCPIFPELAERCLLAQITARGPQKCEQHF